MSNKAAELKALRRKDDTERRRILSQLAEDKAEREQRRQPAAQDQDPAAQGPAPPGEGAAGPSSMAGGPSTTAALLVRTAEGALRASFSADSTLLDVRAWVDESGRVTAASAMCPPRPVVGGGRVLVSTEQTEALRAGREFFEQQTARMREEARSSRAALDAGGGGTDRPFGGGGGGGEAAPASAAPARTYFVVAGGLPGEPRREYLTEEAMASTLLQAGLTPQATLLVRRIGGEAPPQAAAAAAAENENENENENPPDGREDGREDGEEDEEGEE
mmetsp:Transcript_5817/g.18705  ORF Transcript_5817/g.18705 Transcript_5817/m.18705 type:complete len:276 (+) Transcript_5817:63-890(+)